MRSFLILFILTTSSIHAQKKSSTNKHFWHSMETSASANSVWSVWVDVPNWKNWDTGLKDATINESFSAEAKGVITSLEGRKSKFKVVEFTEGKSYTIKTNLPLGSLHVKRFLETQNGITTFTHEVWFQGLTGGLFAKAFGSKFRKMLPDVLMNIKTIAEKE